MPQTTVIPQWKADYPILAPHQKPGGVTITTTLAANAVPNKAMWATPTIQSATQMQGAKGPARAKAQNNRK